MTQQKILQEPDTGVDISVIIPVYNEEKNLPTLCNELLTELEKLDRSHELIFILDGCTDRSKEIIAGYKPKISGIKIISFPRNYGQTRFNL